MIVGELEGAEAGHHVDVVPLPAIEDVQVLRGFVTRIIAIHTPGFVVKVRCLGADAFADQIRSAANDARGAG